VTIDVREVRSDDVQKLIVLVAAVLGESVSSSAKARQRMTSYARCPVRTQRAAVRSGSRPMVTT